MLQKQAGESETASAPNVQGPTRTASYTTITYVESLAETREGSVIVTFISVIIFLCLVRCSCFTVFPTPLFTFIIYFSLKVSRVLVVIF